MKNSFKKESLEQRCGVGSTEKKALESLREQLPEGFGVDARRYSEFSLTQFKRDGMFYAAAGYALKTGADKTGKTGSPYAMTPMEQAGKDRERDL